jgi:hypothetical protein
MFYIVANDKAISEYTEKLVTLISAQGYQVSSGSLDDYKSLTSLSDIVLAGVKVIFMGINPKGQIDLPNISAWQYERFGCRIGWVGSKCVIFTQETNFSPSEYKNFREYCRSLHFEHDDVIVPEENFVLGGLEAVKKMVGNKKNSSAQRAQYSIMVYEFMRDYFGKFVDAEVEKENITPDSVPLDINNVLRNLKDNTLANLAAIARRNQKK